MNSPDSYDDDLVLALDAETLDELTIIEAKLTAATKAATSGPVASDELPDSDHDPDDVLFDLLDPTFHAIIPHLHELDATVADEYGRKAALAVASESPEESPSFHALITDSQPTLCGDDWGASSSPPKLLLSTGSSTNELALVLDNDELAATSGPVPSEELSDLTFIPEQAAAAESPPLHALSQATLRGDDQGGPSSPAKLLGKRYATDSEDEEISTERPSKRSRGQTKSSHSPSPRPQSRPPSRGTPCGEDPDSDHPINFL